MERGSALLLGLCLLAPTVSLADEAAPPPNSDASALELLEFLGEWSGEGEEWLNQQKLVEKESAAAPKAEVKKDDE